MDTRTLTCASAFGAGNPRTSAPRMKAVIASFFMVLSLRRFPRESHASPGRSALLLHLPGRGFIGSLQLLELLIQFRARDVELVGGLGLQLLRGLPELFGLRLELVEPPAGGVPRLALRFPGLSLEPRARAIELF